MDNNKPKTIINKRNKSARINQSTNSISNSLLDITENDDDDDPDTKLELLAIAARQAVETYERKRNQHVPETKQDDDDDGSNDNKVASSVSILDNIKPKTIINKRNKSMNKYDDSLLFFMDPTNINFDIAQAAHNAVQALEVSSKQLLFGKGDTSGTRTNEQSISTSANIPSLANTNDRKEIVQVQTKHDWSKYTVVQLRAELRRRSLPISGNKNKLIQTIQAYESENQKQLVETTVVQRNEEEEEEEGDKEYNDVAFSWQTDLGVSDTLMMNLEKIAQNAQDNIDAYYEENVIDGTSSRNAPLVLPTSITKKDISKSKTTTKASISVGSTVVPDYETMTVAVLKSELRKRKLILSGRKAELIARLVANDADQVNQLRKLDYVGTEMFQQNSNTHIKQEGEKPVQAPQSSLQLQMVPVSNDGNRLLVHNSNEKSNTSTTNGIRSMDNIKSIDKDFEFDDDVTDEDIQALSIIDQLLAGIDNSYDDEPTDEALWAIENELNAVAASVPSSSFNILGNHQSEKYNSISAVKEIDNKINVNNGMVVLAPNTKKPHGPALMTVTDYNSMSVTQLKTELQKRNLRITGKKGDLIERLQASDEFNCSLQ